MKPGRIQAAHFAMWLCAQCCLVSGCMIEFPDPAQEEDTQGLCAAEMNGCDPGTQVCRVDQQKVRCDCKEGFEWATDGSGRCVLASSRPAATNLETAPVTPSQGAPGTPQDPQATGPNQSPASGDNLLKNASFDGTSWDPWTPVSGPSGEYSFAFALESGNQVLKVQCRKDFYQGPGQNITAQLQVSGLGNFQASARVRIGCSEAGIQGLISIRLRKAGTTEWATRQTTWTLLSPSWTTVAGELDLSTPVQGINSIGEVEEAWLSVETACNPSDPQARCDGAKTVDLFVDDVALHRT